MTGRSLIPVWHVRLSGVDRVPRIVNSRARRVAATGNAGSKRRQQFRTGLVGDSRPAVRFALKAVGLDARPLHQHHGTAPAMPSRTTMMMIVCSAMPRWSPRS